MSAEYLIAQYIAESGVNDAIKPKIAQLNAGQRNTVIKLANEELAENGKPDLTAGVRQQIMTLTGGRKSRRKSRGTKKSRGAKKSRKSRR